MHWIRPEGIIINGVLERGLKIALVDGVIQEIRASNHKSEPFIISPAFVNAHSHLEYRGMLDKIPHPEYYDWIYELSRLKPLESPEFVLEHCDLAAIENRQTGVAWIGEHSDRPGSADAMVKQGLGGWIFQEVITAGSDDIDETMRTIAKKMVATLKKHPEISSKYLRTSLNPHAYFTVARHILQEFGEMKSPVSIHVAETERESNFTRTGTGPIADRRRQFGVPFDIYGQSVVEVLNDLAVLRRGTQCVHCCDVDDHDIQILAKTEVTIAHCPRSNIRLQCPAAPVRECLDAGITVGLGMDSPASGGPINMFAEMRAALNVSQERGKPLTAEEVWRMATSQGYKSFGKPTVEHWDIYEGSSTPLITIKVGGAKHIHDMIELAEPAFVSWV
jgi:5-methylthioadenosine/S-adenosylhomocysteine deaminase